jgi:hypothetical protein
MSVHASGAFSYTPDQLADQLTEWFKDVASVIPHEKYKHTGRGQFAEIHTLPGVGKIVAEYLGSTPHKHIGDYLLRLYMVKEDFELEDRNATGPGWFMDFEQHYGGKLVLDETKTVSAEEITEYPDSPDDLAGLLGQLRDSYYQLQTAPVADVVRMDDFREP